MEILEKYCGNIVEILGKYWEIFVKYLDIGEILEKYWGNIGYG